MLSGFSPEFWAIIGVGFAFCLTLRAAVTDILRALGTLEAQLGGIEARLEQASRPAPHLRPDEHPYFDRQ